MDGSTHRAEISEFTGTAYILRKRGFVNQLEEATSQEFKFKNKKL